MAKYIKVILTVSLVFLMSGCYTQFTSLEERYYSAPPKEPVPDSLADSLYDSTAQSQIGEGVDTVVVKEREVCYWHRTFFGDWELRCYPSNYSNYWHSYYSRPWWYTRYNASYYPYSWHCPYHSYYHSSCEYCWYHYDKYYYGYHHNYHHHYNYNPGSSSGQTSGPKKGRHKLRPVPTGGGSTEVGRPSKTIHDASGTQTKPVKQKVKLKGSGRRKALRSVNTQEKKINNQPQQKPNNSTQKSNNTIQKPKNEQGNKQWPRKRRPLRKKD